MNGIKLKSRPSKTKNYSNFKMLFCILLSNIFLFLLLYPSSKESHRLITHENMEKLLLPVRIFMPLPPGKREYLAELYDEKHRLLIRPVYLHPDFAETSYQTLESIHYMPVEVPKKAVKNLIGKDIFLVFPYQQDEYIQQKRKINYEIVF